MTTDWAARWRVRAGYPVALCFLALARPTPAMLVSGAAVATLGLLVRGAAAGYLHKHQRLATCGPYSFTRNPLYLGSAILAAGFAVAGASWIAAAILATYFAIFYPAVMSREESELRARYGVAFEDYARRVPLFWPRLSPSSPPADGSVPPDAGEFSWSQFHHNREYQALLGAIIGLAVLAAKMFWQRG